MSNEIISINCFTASQWRGLRKIITDPRDRALFEMALAHGMKACEIASLRRQDVRLRSGRLHLRRRQPPGCDVPLLARETRDLRAWLRIRGHKNGPLFASRHHRPISRRRLDALLKKYCAAAGISPSMARFHVLRVTCATELVRRGQESLVCHWLGWCDVRETQRYVRVASSALCSEETRR